MADLLLGSALLLAFVNGANDNMKGVATLYGSGALSYKRALLLATISTALGSLASIFIATALVQAFSGRGLVPDGALSPEFLTAVGAAAALTVLLATRLGLPVSTTHALLGGLAGAGWLAAGALDLGVLGPLFLIPLLGSPLVAIGLAWSGVRAGRIVGVEADGLVRWGHLLSAGLVGFARGLNDTPKILGLIVGAAILTPVAGALAIAAAMSIGGALGARRVTQTLAQKITPMSPGQGLAGNLATSLLVIGASRFGLPVSTTHVSGGGILGVGLSTGGLRWRVVRNVAGAWLVTLPAAALLAAGIMWGFE